MKTLNTLFIALVFGLTGSNLIAQSSVPNTFVSGEAASAAEVNANFSAVLDAIDALSAEVDALQVAAPSQSVSGRSYTLLNLRGFTEDQRTGTTVNDVALINFGGTETDITFNANGTLTTTALQDEEIDIGWDTIGGTPFVGQISAGSDPGVTVDYAQDGGIIEIPDFGIEAFASKDGSMLVFSKRGQGFSDDDNDERFEFEIGVFVEIPQSAF